MKKDPRLIGYWILTILLAVALLGSGVANLSRSPDILNSYSELGFPAYLAMILGPWKVLAALVILAPKTPRLKEWAHAGVTFAMTGAFASHLFHGDPIGQALPSLVIAGINLASWWLRPASRTLPSP